MVFFVHGEDEVVEALSKAVEEVFNKRQVDVKVVVENTESKSIEQVAKMTTPFNIAQLVEKYRFALKKVDDVYKIVFLRIPSQIVMMRILRTIIEKDIAKDIKDQQCALIQTELRDINYKSFYAPFCIMFEGKESKSEVGDLFKAYDHNVFKRNTKNITLIRTLDLYKGERDIEKKTEISRRRMRLIATNILYRYLHVHNSDLLKKLMKPILKKRAQKRKAKYDKLVKEGKIKPKPKPKKQGGKNGDKKFGNKPKGNQFKGKGNFSKSNRPKPKGNSSRGPATGNSRGNRNQVRTSNINPRSNGISRNKSKGVNKK